MQSTILTRWLCLSCWVVMGSVHGWTTTTTNHNNGKHIHMYNKSQLPKLDNDSMAMKEILRKSTAFACGLVLAAAITCHDPPSSLALATAPVHNDDYACPQSFAMSKSSGSSPKSISNFINDPSKACHEGDTNLLEFSVQAVIYLPTTPQPQPSTQEASLVISIASVDQPSKALAGAQLPLLFPSSTFPITVSLFKGNLLLPISELKASAKDDRFLEDQWDKRVLYAPYDLVVRAQIIDSDRGGGDAENVYEGLGYSKLLRLDDFRVVRAPANIRLQQHRR